MAFDLVLLKVNHLDGEVEVTKDGVTKYEYLKRKKRYNIIKQCVIWLTLAAAVVSAIYGVFTYYATVDTKKEKRLIQELQQEQPLKEKTLPLIPETTRVHHTDSLQKIRR